jgi:hypothetical protein
MEKFDPKPAEGTSLSMLDNAPRAQTRLLVGDGNKEDIVTVFDPGGLFSKPRNTNKPEPIPEPVQAPEPSEEGGEMSEEAKAYYAKMGILADTQTAAAAEQAARSREIWNIYKKQYLPGELAWAKESFAGIPFDQETGRASSDVNTAFDKSLQARTRQMQGMGVNPASPAYNSVLSEYSAARAAAEAGARNNSRRGLRAENYSRRTAATNLGRGMIGASSSMAGQASSMAGQGAGMLSQGFSGLSNTYENAANRNLSISQAQADRDFRAQQALLAREYQIADRNRQAEAQTNQNLFGLAGTVIGAYYGGGLGAKAGGTIGNNIDSSWGGEWDQGIGTVDYNYGSGGISDRVREGKTFSSGY